MYNFKMTKNKQQQLLEICNFNEIETFIFNELVKGKKRKEIYEEIKEKYDLSPRTVCRYINSIAYKITESNLKEFKHKVYIHKFPNGKKYVGVCQCCEDRWQDGRGYSYNEEMYKAIKKYGWQNIEHKILFETTDNYVAYQLERILIEELDLIENGYNNIL